MRKNRIKAYWVLLMSLILAGTSVLSVGTTQARPENTVTSVAVLATDAKKITSNCLITETEAPRTVLLGEADLENLSAVEVPFWILSSGADATLPLKWFVSDETQAQYFDVVVKLKESLAETSEEGSDENSAEGSEVSLKVLEQGAEVKLIKDTRQELVLCVVPTESARSAAHEELTVDVCVTAGDTMKGTFQIVLPEVVVEEPEEPEEPTEPETPAEPEEPTEPETPVEPVEPTEPETPAEPEEPTEPEMPTEPETPVEPETPTGPETPTEPETPAEPEEPTEPETPVDPEEPTESTEPESTVMLTSFMKLAKSVELTGTSNPVESAVQEESTDSNETTESEEPKEPVAQEEPTDSNETTESEETTDPETETEKDSTTEQETESTVENLSAKLETLPTFDVTQQLPVVMTLEKPATFVRLGIQKQKDENTTFEALPDYTMFSVDNGATYFMVYGDYIHELATESTTMSLLFDFRYTNLIQDEKLTLAMEVFLDDQYQTTCTADVLASVKRDWKSGSILNFENTLEFAFPEEWKDAELTYNVEYLTMTEEQLLQYVPVELSEDGLQATYDKEENNHRLVLALGQKFTQPGTYRLHISWSYNGLCYDTAQTNFFVNCSGWVEPKVSGLEVSNDE